MEVINKKALTPLIVFVVIGMGGLMAVNNYSLIYGVGHHQVWRIIAGTFCNMIVCGMLLVLFYKLMAAWMARRSA